MKDAEIEAEIEDFLEGFNQPTYRGMRINGGTGASLVKSARLERDVGRSTQIRKTVVSVPSTPISGVLQREGSQAVDCHGVTWDCIDDGCPKLP
jgi:hypothetical protein